MLGYTSKDVKRLPQTHYHPSLACSILRIFTNREYLESFAMVSWTTYEFGRTRGAFTATVERDVLEHHTERMPQ
ncbi:hypothetical protein TNCV_4606251 [Trichonephila clavipes]|nr:hypothetical protein TNCV_4606251 [Trichonephila clavipes]